MPPRAAAEAPRRSSRARTKRLATPDAEATEAPAGKNAAADEPMQDGHEKSRLTAKSKGRKRKATTRVDNAEDSIAQAASGAGKASKNAKNATQHTEKNTPRCRSEQLNSEQAFRTQTGDHSSQ